ncbi:hypothetical protein [Sulfuricurvum sp.]|uniref:hypothetical protein n=1 Tax=Sulfuricurvum sp. TaxID=2025608 RepID=UPI003BB1600D
MKQPSTFEDLQALGTEKIHERTHISRDKIELVMTKSYGEIGRVQFMGYMSILEREYGVDLTALKEEYTEYHKINTNLLKPKSSVILQSAANSKPKWIAAGIVLILVLMVGGYLLQGKMSAEPQDGVMELSAVAVLPDDVNVTENNETNVSNETSVNSETNVTTPAVSSETNQTVAKASQPLASGKELAIRPVYKVWYGMIDMASGKKIQNVTAEPIIIDTSKNWLILLGHGRVEIESSAGKTLLQENNTVHFLCENGSLKQISRNEFIEHNGGKSW